MTRSATSSPGAGRTLRDQRRAENFPVAMRLLPQPLRSDLIAIYGVARTIDDLGHQAAGDRTALLRAFADDLARTWAGPPPAPPALRPLPPGARRGGLVGPGGHRVASRRALAGRGRGLPRRAGLPAAGRPGGVRRAGVRPGPEPGLARAAPADPVRGPARRRTARRRDTAGRAA